MDFNIGLLQKKMVDIREGKFEGVQKKEKFQQFQNKLMYLLNFQTYSHDLDYIPQSHKLSMQLIELLRFATDFVHYQKNLNNQESEIHSLEKDTKYASNSSNIIQIIITLTNLRLLTKPNTDEYELQKITEQIHETVGLLMKVLGKATDFNPGTFFLQNKANHS